MSTLYAIWAEKSACYATHQGRVIVHPSRAEMEYLFPACRIVPVRHIPPAEQLPLRDHPDMASVRWPLDRRDFERN